MSGDIIQTLALGGLFLFIVGFLAMIVHVSLGFKEAGKGLRRMFSKYPHGRERS